MRTLVPTRFRGTAQMKTFTRLLAIAVISFATVTGCGGGGGGDGGAVTPPAAAPPANRPLAGQWNGHAVTLGSPDFFTSFEEAKTGPFTEGISPFTASFSNGNAETRGDTALYITGDNAWHILIGTSAR